MTRSEIRKQNRKQKLKHFRKELFEDIRDIFIIVGLCLLVKAYILDLSLVYGHSMEPNISEGDMIILKKWDIHLGEKGNGINFYDKVALDNVEIEGLDKPISIVKRVIGLPGDRIEIIDGSVYRNGILLDEPLIKEKAEQINQTFEVGENEVFVMGDNRNHSTDSRYFGPQPIGKVAGEVIGKFEAKWLMLISQKVRGIFNIEQPL